MNQLDAAFKAELPDLQAMQRALLASEERLRKLVASANDAVVVMDAKGLVVDWNPRAQWMFGWSAQEAIGQRLSELVIPLKYRERHESGLRRYINTRQSRVMGRSVELEALRRDGSELPIELSIWPLDAGGDILFGAFIRDISSRHAAQQALRLQEEKYRSVVDHVSEGILVVRDGRIVFANPSTERMVGLSLAQMQAVPFTELIHPDDQAMVRERHLRRLRGEPVEQHYAFRVPRADGSVVWLELSAVQIDWEDAPATLSFITDITERRRLEEGLKQTLAERDTILDNSIVGILFLDRDRRVRWANSAMAAMFGMSRESAKGLSSEQFYPSIEDYERTGAAVVEAVRAGRGFEIEMPMRRANGELFWAYVSGRAVDRSDLLQGTVWAVLDISRRKALEAALQRKTEEQEAILQSSLVGISLISQRRFQWVNRTLAEMIGRPVDELIGAEVRILFPEEEACDLTLATVSRDLDAQGSYQATHELQRRDGERIWVQLQGRRLHAGESARGSLWTFLDVSERIRAEQEVRRALEKEQELGALKSRFVSMTSHEFRTPLAGILSSMELLQHYGDRLPDDEKRELFEQIEASVQRMTRMLDNILLVGRAESKGLSFKPRAADLRGFIDDLVVEAQAIRLPGAVLPTLRVEVGALAASYDFDPTLLHHALANLLSNAIKYSPQGGEVLFGVQPAAGMVCFVVQDQGIGIPLEDQPRLFDSFHRASNVGSIAGTGLGLAIVKQAVELHGGRIELYSEPGRGTRFNISLPINPSPGSV